jgi:hypothetical protein
MNTLVVLAEEAAEAHEGVPAWIFGVTGFVVLLLLLFVVTRFDPNR